MNLIPLLFSSLTLNPQAGVSLEPLPTGAMAKIGFYAPQRLDLTDVKPATVRAIPADVTAPHYGEISIGGRKFVVLTDEPAGKPARLFVDSNGDGDLTNDAVPTWKAFPYKDSKDADRTRFAGSGTVEIMLAGKKTPVSLGMYRFDAADEGRAALKNVLLYYRDYAVKGTLTAGGKTYPIILSDDMAHGDFTPVAGPRPNVTLLIDRDGDGKFTAPAEYFDPSKPFNLGGTTYELKDLAKDGGSFRLMKSTQTVAEIPLPPNLSIGRTVVPFEAETTGGEKISFPNSYKGKIVMLDFWATWCGPCIGELPNVTKAYSQYGGKGFEILSISLDKEGDGQKLADFTKEHGMPWSQVYDGKFWDARVAQLYAVRAIPFVLLVDGDTGKILADASTLRGPGLSDTIGKFLAAKQAGK